VGLLTKFQNGKNLKVVMTSFLDLSSSLLIATLSLERIGIALKHKNGLPL